MQRGSRYANNRKFLCGVGALLREMDGKQGERQAAGVRRHMRRIGDQSEAAGHDTTYDFGPCKVKVSASAE